MSYDREISTVNALNKRVKELTNKPVLTLEEQVELNTLEKCINTVKYYSDYFKRYGNDLY